MIIVRNNVIPFPGYKAINLFGVLFVRKDAQITETTIQHEGIHTKQMQEMLYIFFYLWFLIERLVKLFCHKFNSHEAYRAISFEREAYANEAAAGYLESRKHYCWMKYIKG